MFKFEINNEMWSIKEVVSNWIRDEYNQKTKSDANYVFGLTDFANRKIYINICQDFAQKRRTLMHELMHTYLWTVGACNFSQFDEEDLCNFSSASHYIIHKIVEEYFSNSNNLSSVSDDKDSIITKEEYELYNTMINKEDLFPCEND